MTAPDPPGAPAPSRRAPRPIAAPILGVLSALHGFLALVFVLGGRTPVNEVEGFMLGVTASVLMTGAVLSYGLVRLLREVRAAGPRPH
jgi:hypothetical protein